MDKIAVLIPCYNESKTIAKVVADYRAALPEADIYVYDNNSTDGTDEIARAVSEEFGTGLTIIDAHGFYSDTPKTVLYVVVNRFQTVKLKALVKGVDANAYMAISPVADLLHGSKEEETA